MTSCKVRRTQQQWQRQCFFDMNSNAIANVIANAICNLMRYVNTSSNVDSNLIANVKCKEMRYVNANVSKDLARQCPSRKIRSSRARCYLFVRAVWKTCCHEVPILTRRCLLENLQRTGNPMWHYRKHTCALACLRKPLKHLDIHKNLSMLGSRSRGDSAFGDFPIRKIKLAELRLVTL